MPATTSYPLQPQDLENYAAAWQEIIRQKDESKLQDCFRSFDNSKANYTYLPLTYAKQIVRNAPVSIQSVLVAVPSDGQTVFSTVFFGFGENGQPTSDLYLAGVAIQPAVIEQEPSISYQEVDWKYAANIVDNWKAQPLDKLTAALFNTEYGPLRLFTHEVTDFQQAIADAEASGGEDNALWFGFGLHDGTNPIYPDVRFATVLVANQLPVADKAGVMLLEQQLHYYDLSKPCPPACYHTYSPPTPPVH